MGVWAGCENDRWRGGQSGRMMESGRLKEGLGEREAEWQNDGGVLLEFPCGVPCVSPKSHSPLRSCRSGLGSDGWAICG